LAPDASSGPRSTTQELKAIETAVVRRSEGEWFLWVAKEYTKKKKLSQPGDERKVGIGDNENEYRPTTTIYSTIKRSGIPVAQRSHSHMKNAEELMAINRNAV
jgi:hypothetical protein